jgi:hypothetical protein
MDKPPFPTHHLLVENADWSGVLKVRHEGASWDSLRTRTGLPALGMAIFENSAVATQLLLEAGAPPHPQPLFNGSPWSPLWAAVTRENHDIMEMLLQAGANPDEPHPEDGINPLEATARTGDEQGTIILCRHGARPNSQTIPSPLWLWINRLQPRQDEQGQWHIPSLRPVLSLLSAGARVEETQAPHLGVEALELARRRWVNDQLPEEDLATVRMVLAALERAALREQTEDRVPVRQTNEPPKI